MRAFLSIALYRVKSFYRDTFTFFFTLILPIIFAVIFGFVFGGNVEGTSGSYEIKIGVIKENIDLVKVLGNIEGVKVSSFDRLDEMKNEVLKGYLDAGVILEEDTFNVIINFSSFQQKPFLRTFGENLANSYSLYEAGIKQGFLKVKEEFIDPGKARVSTLGYIIPGVLSFSISSSIFAMIALFGYYRKRKVIKRFAVTPISPITFVAGMVVGNFIVSLLSCIFVLLFTNRIFNINFSINWGLFILSVSCSILGMMAFGILLTALFKEPQTANNVGNLLVNVMMFFSGVYFPLDFLPKYLKIFSQFLPLYYVGKILRTSVGVEENPVSFVISVALVMFLVFLILVSIFSRNILRLEEE